MKLFSLLEVCVTHGISAGDASVSAWQGTHSQRFAQAHQDQDRNMTTKDVNKPRRSMGPSACIMLPGIAV